jgi:signal transduction histidine kinase
VTEAERRHVGRRAADSITGVAFEDAFVALTDGILISDGNGNVLSANPAAFRLLGEDTLIGRPFEDLLLVSGAVTVQNPEGQAIRRAWFPREERMGVLEIVSTPLAGSTPRATIHTVRDVTASAELLRLKKEFLLDVAHELRTPIAVLTASLDLVHQDATTMPREELQTMVGTLRRGALRLEHLVENLLDAGSIEAGTFEVRAVSTSIKDIIEESLVFVRSVFESKSQRLVTHYGRGTDRVVCDPRRTAQVFANLLGNAGKYGTERSDIMLRTESSAGFVKITVHNDGPAIPPDELARLFQRFFRSRTVRGEAGGLGLGLTICRAIVQAQGGEIGVDSAPDRGTSVHFTLPKARELAQEAGSA